MSTQFDTDFSDANNDIIEANHVKQFALSVNDLESGLAFYREADSGGDGSPYEVSFRKTDSRDEKGNFLEDPLTAGQMVVFKANVDSPVGGASLAILLEDGASGTSSGPIPLFSGDTQVGPGQIKAEQIVVAIYNNTSPPRFDVVGVSGSSGGGGLTSPVAITDGGTGAITAAGARTNLDVPSNADLTTGLAGKSNTGHVHAISEVTGLQTALDGKQDDLTGVSDVPGLQTALDAKQDDLTGVSDVPGLQTALDAKQDESEKGQANGYASLDATGKVPASQLPTSGGGASDLDDLTDVAISTPADGHLLQYDDSTDEFVNRSPADAGLVQQSRSISTTAPLSGGGDLSADRTLSMAQASASVDGYLDSADFATFAGKQDALTEPDDVPGLTSALAAKQDVDEKGDPNGYAGLDGSGNVPKVHLDHLETDDLGDVSLTIPKVAGQVLAWNGFGAFQNVSLSGLGAVEQSRTISTTAPLSGGGDLSANRTLSMAQASASVDGYLDSADFATFAGKQDALTEPDDVPGLTSALDAKQDASEKGQADGYASLDGGGKVPNAQLEEVLALDDLTDVAISSPTSGQVVRHNGTGFTNAALAAGDLPTGIDAANIGSGDVSNTEFGYLDGVTSGVQAQLDSKASSTHTHAASDITSGQLDVARGGTGSDLSATGGSGQVLKQSTSGGAITVGALAASDMPTGIDPTKLSPGTVNSTEFGYLNGVTSSIQSQIDNHTHSTSDITSGTLGVSRGGTGLGSLAANRLLGSGATSNVVQAITIGSGLSLSGGSLSSTVSSGPQVEVYQVYTRDSTASQTVNTTAWTSLTGCSGTFSSNGTGSVCLFQVQHMIGSLSAQPNNLGDWRLQLTKSGSTTLYVPNSTGVGLVSPYVIGDLSSMGGSFVITGLSAGTWTVALQMKADTSNGFLAQTNNSSATCSVLVIGQ
jgi:hypothetical protein